MLDSGHELKRPALTPVKTIPARGSFYSLQGVSEHTNYPPLPFDPFPGLPLFQAGLGEYIFNDSSVDYQTLQAQTSSGGTMSAMDMPAPPGGGSGGGGAVPAGSGSTITINSNGLYLTVVVDTNGNADITVINTTNGFYYQLLSTTNLSLVETDAPDYTQNWQLGPMGYGGMTQWTFSVPTNGQPIQFFQVHQAAVDLNISASENGTAVLPGSCGQNNGQDGVFIISTPDDNPSPPVPMNLPVYYQIGGSALNGVDYTNLTGVVTIPSGLSSVVIHIHPQWFCSNGLAWDSTVTLTLLQNSNYVIDPDYPSDTVTLLNTNVNFTLVANLGGLDGLDYDSVSNCLIAGDEYNNGYLAQIQTNGTGLVVTQFSGMTEFGDYAEPEVAVVKVTTNGFTNGWIYVGNGNIGAIGRSSPDGTSYTNNWVTLPGTVVQSLDLHPHIILYVDQTGIFSNDLVAVAGNPDPRYTNTIWLVDSTGKSTLLASTPSDLFEWEGLITLPNNPNKYGVLAGKIAAGLESGAMIYTIDTNGAMTPYYTTNWVAGGIQPECFNIIPTNVASQNLYWANEYSGLFKLSGMYFTNYVGDLLITQGGEVNAGLNPPALYVAHWDTNNLQFDLKFIYGPSNYWGQNFEDTTFAPF
jgi:hypothetical protein